MDFQTREELNQWLNSFDYSKHKLTEFSSVYFLVQYDGVTEPVYFMQDEGNYFESPCAISCTGISNKGELRQYVRDIYCPGDQEEFDEILKYEDSMWLNGRHYSIDCPQCLPYLKFPCAVIRPLSESEVLGMLVGKEEDDGSITPPIEVRA